MEQVIAPHSHLLSTSNGIKDDTSNPIPSLHSISNSTKAGEATTSAEVRKTSKQSSTECCLESSSESCQTVKSCLAVEEGDKLIDSKVNCTKPVFILGENIEKDDVSTKVSSSSDNVSLVPNFHVEGSGLGDCSITVAIASLTSAVPLSTSACTHQNHGGNTSGPASSTEEMKISLVSWYSEPDDASRIVGDSSGIPCCLQSTSFHLENGRQAISMSNSVMFKSGSEEKENRTPEPVIANGKCTEVTTTTNGINFTPEIPECKDCVTPVSGKLNRTKMHVQLLEQKSTEPIHSGSKHGCNFKDSSELTRNVKSIKPDCPRCSRKSKSGSATPSAIGSHVNSCSQSRTRTPANRRVVQSSKSSMELKKPIKSILKRESRGSGGSGSGSDNKSSMDSLGSSAEMGMTPLRHSGTLMSRSDSGCRAKFNLNHQVLCETSSEDKFSSKLRRIEKYATLRLRKSIRVKPLEFSDTDITNSCTSGGDLSSSGGCSKVSTPNNDLMSKSMSFLEKSTVRIESGNAPLNSNSSLKRQGSLRLKKGPNVWEPCTTRTTALRMQKMQESKAKSSGGYSSTPNSAKDHTGSGDSIHHHSTSSLHHQRGVSSSSKTQSQTNHKDKIASGIPAKVFVKLFSAFGQTASSNQKRLRQEKSVQTEEGCVHRAHSHGSIHSGGDNATSLSPIPGVDSGVVDLTEQTKKLERLANRYRNTALRFQSEYEKSEAKNTELTKQLLEFQSESNEMIEFLQAEKSTLAESLAELENEAKKWRSEIETIKNDSQSRCSSLVRLSEQHKQEALRSKALLNRFETQTSSLASKMSSKISEGVISISSTKDRVAKVTEALLKTYKISESLLKKSTEANSMHGPGLGDGDLRSSLLLPLINSLAATFPLSYEEISHTKNKPNPNGGIQIKTSLPANDVPVPKLVKDNMSSNSCLTESTSLQTLNQAILDREAAETVGLDEIDLKNSEILHGLRDEDQFSLHSEAHDLNLAISKLFLVIRVIVIHCDKRVSEVTSNILECLQSIEDDKVGSNPTEMVQVQKSLEA